MFSFFAIPTMPALACAALTLWLPRKWLLAWLPLLWLGSSWAYRETAASYPEGDLSAAILFLPFYLINIPASIGRVGFTLVRIHDETSRGYGDPE